MNFSEDDIQSSCSLRKHNYQGKKNDYITHTYPMYSGLNVNQVHLIVFKSPKNITYALKFNTVKSLV